MKPQAEAITRLHQQAANATIDYIKHEHSLENVVTNKDLDARIKETELKIELVKSELKRDIESVRKETAETKAELIRWVVWRWRLTDYNYYGSIIEVGRDALKFDCP